MLQDMISMILCGFDMFNIFGLKKYIIGNTKIHIIEEKIISIDRLFSVPKNFDIIYLSI